MYPASGTEDAIIGFLRKCKARGVRVKLLKLSNREAFRLRYHLYWPPNQPIVFRKTLFGVPYKIVNEDRWTR